MTLRAQPLVNPLRYEPGGDKYIADAAYTCDGCNRMSVVTWMTSYDPNDTRWQNYGRDGGPEEYESALWNPVPGHQQSFEDVPEDIALAASEAWQCQVAGASRGAVMLARAVVESTAKAKGIETGSLYAKIEDMANRGLIRSAVREQAHEIRHFGNSSAHGDLGDAVSAEDCKEVLNLMGEVLNEVWQSPARASRLAGARRARKASNP